MLGSHVMAALSAHGFEAIACGRSHGNAARVWNLAEWKTDAELDAIFASAAAIVHAGAAVPSAAHPLNDGELFDANVRASSNLGEWARKRGVPIVHVSGAIVYADLSAKCILESASLGWSGLGGFYGLSKLLAEDVLRREEQAGLRLAVLRPTSIYGHGLSAEKMVASLAARAARGEVIELTGPVSDSSNFIHAADVAAAVVRIIERNAWATFNLGSAENTSVLDLARTCVAVAGRGKVQIAPVQGAPRSPTSRFQVDCGAARRTLDWAPRLDLSDGIRSMLDQTAIVLN
jgi:UDP-glucose 4-epimerase